MRVLEGNEIRSPPRLGRRTLLYNIFINDIFLLLNHTKIWSYADDVTIHFSHEELRELILKLENDAVELSN